MPTFSIAELYSYLFSYVAPPFPLPDGEIGTDGLKRIPANAAKQLAGRIPGRGLLRNIRGDDEIQEIAPLSLQIDEQEPWQLPIEPIIEIRGGNKVVRRHAQRSKQRGTYKEYWQADDLQLLVRGVFIGEDRTATPTDELKAFRTHMKAAQIRLLSPLLEPLEASLVVVHSWQLPHTPGINNQGYVFRCYSDALDYELLSDA